MAITGPAYAFHENINGVLENKEVKIVMKDEDDLHFNPRDIIIPSETSFVESGLLRKPRFSGTQMGISSHGFYYYNTSIKHLFAAAFRNQFLFTEVQNRTIIEVADSWKINFPPQPSTIEQAKLYEKWKQENMYTYYLRFSKSQSRDAIFKKVLSDLQNYFGEIEKLTVAIERRKILCIILKPHADHAEDYKKVNTYMIREYIDRLSPIPVIDETGNPKSVAPIDFDNIPSGYENLKIYLASFGIDVVKEFREIEMMVIKDKH